MSRDIGMARTYGNVGPGSFHFGVYPAGWSVGLTQQRLIVASLRASSP